MKSIKFLAAVGLLASTLTTSGLLAASQFSSSASSAPSCRSSRIAVTHGAPQGTAGTTYIPLRFTNEGAACAIWGVPVIQPVVGASHKPVGPGARNLSTGEMPVRHVVAKGAAVSVAFGVVDTGNYSASACVARSASGVIVTLGSFARATYLHLPITVCTKRWSVTTRLIVPGVSGY
jgi:hypothetical protein